VSAPFRRAAFSFAVAALAGCAGAQLAPPEPPSVAEPAGAAASGSLLYVSDVGTNEIYVYSYPGGSPAGSLKGFATPLAECAGAAGDVFVVNTNKSDVLRYAHGGTKPIAILKDAGELPQDCAHDRATGDLAVTNYGPSGSNAGSVAVFKQSKGTPRLLKDAGVLQYLFCAYDGQGDLFVDGLDFSFNFVLIELPKGGTKFARIALNQRFKGWGALQWDGKDLAIGDGATTIYRFAIGRHGATRIGVTQLKRASNVVQFSIQGTSLIAADGPNGGRRDVGFWKYPAGGDPMKTLTGKFRNPSGVALSPP
jgi:hypothetical protein